jgi:hypothetical protein
MGAFASMCKNAYINTFLGKRKVLVIRDDTTQMPRIRNYFQTKKENQFDTIMSQT